MTFWVYVLLLLLLLTFAGAVYDANRDELPKLDPIRKAPFVVFVVPPLYGLVALPIYGFFVMPWWQPIVGALVAVPIGIVMNIGLEPLIRRLENRPRLLASTLAAVCYCSFYALWTTA